MSDAVFDVLDAALFNGEPKVGSTDCSLEIRYAGYKRVPFVSDGRTNLTGITFPASEQDEPVFATHVAAIDGRGVIVAADVLGDER